MQRKLGVRVDNATLGRGVFAVRRFTAEQLIGEVEGRVIDDLEYDSEYGIDLGGTMTLDPGPPFRFLNHSCEPNCALLMDDENDEGQALPEPRILVEVIRDIEPGDELTIDYGWPAESAIRCGCQSVNCRGWVVSLEDLPKLQAPA